jgi:hypothetical protein
VLWADCLGFLVDLGTWGGGGPGASKVQFCGNTGLSCRPRPITGHQSIANAMDLQATCWSQTQDAEKCRDMLGRALVQCYGASGKLTSAVWAALLCCTLGRKWLSGFLSARVARPNQVPVD